MDSVTTLTLQLIDDDPEGIRVCRVEAESLITVVIPREVVNEAKRLPDIPQRGIYYLIDEDHGNISRVYAGQTTQGISRLDNHRSNKDFWNKAIMFLDAGQNINRDALDGLEAKAVDYIRAHGSYEVENTNTPNPYVNPYKEGAIERLHESILFRMKVLGYDLDRKDSGPSVSDTIFHTRRNGIKGIGRYDKDTGKFIVFAGSQVDLSRSVLKNEAVNIARERLFGNQLGVVDLAEDLEFSTPSAAAVFVLGGSQNGWVEWVNDQGRTLDQVYRNEKNDVDSD